MVFLWLKLFLHHEAGDANGGTVVDFESESEPEFVIALLQICLHIWILKIIFTCLYSQRNYVIASLLFLICRIKSNFLNQLMWCPYIILSFSFHRLQNEKLECFRLFDLQIFLSFSICLIRFFLYEFECR